MLGFLAWFWKNTSAKAGLQIETGGVATDIYLDGVKIGTSPLLNQELKPGKYTLLLRPTNTQYVSYQREVNLAENFLSVVIWEPAMSVEESGGIFIEPKQLTKRQADELSAKLAISSSPDKILVKIDDGEALVTPQKNLGVAANNYLLNFSLPSYESREQKIQVVDDEEIMIFVKLTKTKATKDSSN